MKSLIETIAKALVDHPDDVYIDANEDDQKVTYVLKVHPDDVGKVIGKQGRVATAIRTVVNSAASQHDKRVYVKIDD
jgi:predicted RNA-binding protein YlqC (UPF0109 family)